MGGGSPLLIFSVLVMGFALLLSGQARNGGANRPAFSSGGTPDALARQILEAMSDEQVLAQTFMLGWRNDGALSDPSPLILDWIRTRNIGGVKIFGWNTRDTTTRRLAETVGSLQRQALAGSFGIPLFVATDQEGGFVRHVKGSTSETPGNMAIGASGYPEDARLAGYYIARELALLGINMNFAPTVDLYTNRDSELIGTRSFSSDPVHAGILGAAFARGEEAAGVMPTAKHFPGHGATAQDSHGVLPRIRASFEELWERELLPYRILAREGIPAVMSGHLAFPDTPGGTKPASLSPWFLGTVLRERIGFQGLVITDDLEMSGAIISAGSPARAAKEALLAGNDIILFSRTPQLNDPVWTTLLGSMRQEPVFRARVRDAALRVLTAKLDWLRRENAPAWVPDAARAEREIPLAEGTAFFLDLAARSVTVAWGGADQAGGTSGRDSASGRRIAPVIPLPPENAGRVLLAGRYQEFLNIGRIAYPGATHRWYGGQDQDPDNLRWWVRHAPDGGEHDTVIFCISRSEDIAWAEALRGMGKRVILFSVLSPVYLDALSWADGAIAVYSYSRESFIAGFSALTGKIPARGRLPWWTTESAASSGSEPGLHAAP